MRALAASLVALVLTTLAAAPQSAFAQAQDRGYGGPATVGPNFSTGKQSEAPDYGSGAAKQKPVTQKPAAAKQQAPAKSKSAAKPSKQKPSKPKAVAKSRPSPTAPTTAATSSKPDEPKAEEAKTEDTKSDTAAKTDGTDTTAGKPETCRRFDATTGTTVEVACN